MKDNKLIAEFMGFTYEKNIGWYDNDMNMPQIVYDVQNGNCFNELLFDQSWDWLMPVVEKCYNTNADYSLHKKIEDTFMCITCNRIKLVYDAVVDYIKEQLNN
jgi:hypothetical protein